MDLTKAIGIAKEKKKESDELPKTWKEQLPSTVAKSQMSRNDRKIMYEQRRANLKKQMEIATKKAKEREAIERKY